MFRWMKRGMEKFVEDSKGEKEYYLRYGSEGSDRTVRTSISDGYHFAPNRENVLLIAGQLLCVDKSKLGGRCKHVPKRRTCKIWRVGPSRCL